ncbi:MAG: hypothetical protein O9295_07090 [Microcystis sp. LE18-22.4A]|jgi:hypothetical protein|nr:MULTISPECIES: hypothetical protein [Microcystis]MCZ8117821.1 hypothetical protein [Microcystis sp. LE18-22.4A]
MSEPLTLEDIYQLFRAGETFFCLKVKKTGFFEKPVFLVNFGKEEA